jgi:hypothetical protein
MARVFKFKENMLGTDIHTFMDMVNNRPNKEIFISGNKVSKNSMNVNDLEFICVNGDLLYSCRAACVGPYNNGVPGQTEICLKDIVRLENPVRWSNYPELFNVAGPAWTNLSQDQVNFIFSLQPAELRMEIEEVVEEEVVEEEVVEEEIVEEEVVEEMNYNVLEDGEGNALEDGEGNALDEDLEDGEGNALDEDLEDGEEFFGTLLHRHQINDIRQHLVMCEMSQLRAAMGRRMRELNQMSDRDILNFALNQNYF